MTSLLKKIEESSFDRRRFVQVAATAGVVAGLGLTGCDNKVTETTKDSPTLVDLEGGEWIPFNCLTWGNCGFRCYNQAYVVDGVMIRQATEQRPDSEDNPQHRGCPKGRSVRRILTSPERLKYPMKRKNWQPGGGSNTKGEMRGVDEWERISWDEAIDYVANELVRIRDTYGNRSFLALGSLDFMMNSGLLGSPTLNMLGGCLTTWGQASQGGFPVVSNNMRGVWSSGCSDSQDRMSLRHSKLIVLWGINPAWSASGGDMYHFLNAKRKSGAKVIIVDPFFHPSAQALADEWVPCRPGTDGALLEALAHEMISNNLQDQEYLDTHCVGFDAEHMPEDAKSDENFKDYILGAYDGQPKTAEWASKICGTPVEQIKSFARQIATTKPTAFKSSSAPARTFYGNRYAQLFFAVGWMTGNEGVLGGEVSAGSSFANSHFGTIGGTSLVAFGASGYKRAANPICTEPRGLQGWVADSISGGYDPAKEYGIPFGDLWKSIVVGQYHLPGPNGVTRELDIKCILRDNCWSPATQIIGGDYFERAMRKVEFVVINDIYLTNDAQYADIVLPVQTPLELDYSISFMCTPSDFVFVGRRIIEPYYEAKADCEIYYMIADKLKIGEDVAPRLSTKQATFNQIMAGTIRKPDGSGERETLVSVTEEDLKFYGIEGAPQEGKIPIKELIDNVIYQVERKDGDNYMNVFNKAFREDPEANPLKTPSGKNEIYCQRLKDYYDLAMLHDIDALPKYKPAVDGYEQSLTETEYVFQMVTPHHIRQAGSTFANVKQLNEVFPNDLIMNSGDAQKKGFKRGDWVLASNSDGAKIARRLNTSPCVVPGVVILAPSNWREVDQETGVDIGGNANTVTKPTLTGDGYQAFNSVLLKIEKYTGKELLPDYKRAPIVPLSE